MDSCIALRTIAKRDWQLLKSLIEMAMNTHAITFLFADGASYSAQATSGQLLTEVAQGMGLSLLTDCGNGQCGTCAGQCVSGTVSMDGHDMAVLSQEEVDDGALLCCTAQVSGSAVIELPYDASDACAGDEVFQTAVVSAVQELAQEVIGFELTPQDDGVNQSLTFLPGQYVRLRWQEGGETRAYSMANAVGESTLRFCVRVVEGGQFSEWLNSQAKAGSQIEFSAPRGQFFLRDDTGPKVMVAGGSGLAPFLSMLRTLALSPNTPQAQAPMTLIIGARSPAYWFSHDELQAMQSQLPSLRVHWVAEQGALDGAYTGYPSDLLAQVLASSETPAKGSTVYLCGPPAMVAAAQDAARQAGVTKSRLLAERFT